MEIPTARPLTCSWVSFFCNMEYEQVEVNSQRWLDLEDLTNEEWRDVVGYEGLYKVSNYGRIKRVERWNADSKGRHRQYKEKILMSRISKQTGYLCNNLSKDGGCKTFNVHRLLAIAFIPNPHNLPCINHKDCVRTNSVLWNLEWCSHGYNNNYSLTRKMRIESIRKHWEHSNSHKKIYQYSKTGNLISVYDCGPNKLKKIFGKEITCCLLHKCKTVMGFVWRYEGDPFSYDEDIPKRHQKYVIELDENNTEIRRFKSISDAAKEFRVDRHCFASFKQKNGIVRIGSSRLLVENKKINKEG